MKEIQLFNRDGANLKLVTEDEKLWQFKVDKAHEYILEYMTISYENDGSIITVDPSGGPYISKGQRISKEHVIDDILSVDGKIIIRTTNCLV